MYQSLRVHLIEMSAMISLAVLAPSIAEAAGKTGGSRAGRVVVDKSFGKQTTPSEVRQITHPSGRKDTYYGATRNSDGSIGRPHGHTVQHPSGRIEYARTNGGVVLKDAKVSVPTQPSKESVAKGGQARSK